MRQPKILLINFLLEIHKKESHLKMLFIINGSFKLIKNEQKMILILKIHIFLGTFIVNPFLITFKNIIEI